jgi:hypothetical protein
MSRLVQTDLTFARECNLRHRTAPGFFNFRNPNALGYAARVAWFRKIASASSRLVIGTPIPIGGGESLEAQHSGHLTS